MYMAELDKMSASGSLARFWNYSWNISARNTQHVDMWPIVYGNRI